MPESQDNWIAAYLDWNMEGIITLALWQVKLSR
jgi:hypothetical protein